MGSCHICGSHFISQSGYNHHMKNSHGDTTYACVECGKEYKTKKTLEFHFKCNHLPKTHICETCGAKFPTETLLGSHRSSHQTDPKDFEFSCTICERRFKSKKLCLIILELILMPSPLCVMAARWLLSRSQP